MDLNEAILGMELQFTRDELVLMVAEYMGWAEGFRDWNLSTILVFDDNENIVVRLRKEK